MARGDNVKLSVVGSNAVAALVTEFSRLGVPADRAALWARCINGNKANLEVPETLNDLYLSQYQFAALRTLGCAGGILALDTGLGKTLTTSAACVGYAKQGFNKRCYVFAPVNALGAWKAYMPVFEEHFEDVALLSIDSLHKAQGLDVRGGVAVFDEVHLLGNENSKRTKFAHSLRKRFDVGLCLTGTLTTSRVDNALSALDLATPGAALFSDFYKAGEYFNCLVRKDIPGVAQPVTEIVKPTGENFDAFCDYLARHTISIKKHSDVAKEAGIPPQDVETIELGKPWKSLEDEIIETAKAKLAETGEVPDAAWCRAELRRKGLQTKLEWLEWFVQQDDEPLVIAAWSLESLEELRNAAFLQSHVYVDGSVTGKARQEAVRAFQTGEARFYIGQVDASCVSVDLFRANKSVLLETTNRAANFEQFMGRTARRGQTRRCTHYDVVANVYQQRLLNNVRQGKDFDASVAENILVRETTKQLRSS